MNNLKIRRKIEKIFQDEDGGKKLIKLTCELIKIKSVSGEEQKIGLFIEKYLINLGFKTKRQYIQESKKGGNSNKRFNILAGDGEIMFSTHIDTVPDIGMEKAFSPKLVGDKIFGRGSADTKGAIASLLLALYLFKKLSKKLPKVSLCFTVDEEEWSSLGSKKISKSINSTQAIVIEPTSLEICTKQEGSFEFEILVQTESAHGSVFELYENPSKILFEIIQKIENKLNKKVSILEICGGWRYYAVPKNSKALLEVKIKEGEKLKEIEKNIKAIVEEVKKLKEKSKTKIQFKVLDSEDFIEFKKGNLSEKIKECMEEIGIQPKFSVMPSWTDAAEFHKKNIECVVFGPGDIQICHTEKEHIRISELEKFTKILLAFFLKYTF
ncbi:MAG: M20/M25/M40 family metallo-hydrolase [Candidatus Calescibacterium sp.]|jgi:acetylornithine deacetylase/succinyl-diaminopimelate desuccinylase|nr:M20/M25/M40 family metallo-hydrolase [Candidatus Calescibacterium sp.]